MTDPADRRVFYLDAEQYDAFVEFLERDTSPEQTEKLRKLLNTRPPWANPEEGE